MNYSLVRIKRRWVPEQLWRKVCRLHRSGAIGRAMARPLARILTRDLCEFERFKFG